MKKSPVISRADYNTILLHTEKISNGQRDFIPVLRRELQEKLNIVDAEPLVVDLVRNKDIEFLNRVRLFLSQYPFIVESDKGVRYQLVKRGNFCELDFVEETVEPADDDTPAQELEVRAERIRRLQADVQRGIIQIGFELLAAKKEVGHGGWADWLQKEFEWGQQTANRFMRVAERFGKLSIDAQFKPTTLIKMLALPEGDEQAFIEAQSQAGTPVENQSAREVQSAVKQWKKDKKKKSLPPVVDEINLFPEIDESGNQSVDESKSDNIVEYEPNLDFDSSDSNLTSTPTEKSDDDVAPDELSQTRIHEENPPLETSTVNSCKESFDDDLIAMRDEMQKLLAEITELMQRATKTELADTFQILKSVRDRLN